MTVTTGCSTCGRSAQLMEGMPERWECSHVDCPHRRQVTAAPPEGNHFAREGSGCWRVRPMYQED